ncbi:MAG: GNAT family N-acetyltransferase [Terrimonas sp.]|nr:GNAT family N-acetyltransferase [Terrimonas sp.]
MYIQRIHTRDDLSVIAALAEEIIPDYYRSFLPMDQIRFFIDHYQSLPALLEQVQNNFEYYLVTDAGVPVAYLGLEIKKDMIWLSKIYIRSLYRGKGIGKTLLELAKFRAVELQLSCIELFVVKGNQPAIDFYRKQGYTFVNTIANAYDSGYTVTEYRMRNNC